MFGALFDKVTGLLEKQFIVTYFLPSLIFWGLLVVVWFIGQGRFPEALALWETGAGMGWILQLIGFFAWLVLFANILASQSMTIFRLYEGYWNFPGADPVRRLGQSWHQRKLERIEASLPTEPKRYREIYFGYPLPGEPEEIMPTRLGNMLKNAELYPRDRYGMDAVLIWPRLYTLFPESFKQMIIELRTGLDFMLMISFLAAVFALLSGAYLLWMKASPFAFLYSFGGGLVVAVVAYRASLGSALLYAQQIKTAFDLYRNELLKQMRVPLPETNTEERTTWAELSQLIYRNIAPVSWTYESEESGTGTAVSTTT